MRGDKKMLKPVNFASHNHSPSQSKDGSDIKKLYDDNKAEISEKQKQFLPTFESGKKMDNLDFFLTILIKNLNPNERFLLLNKLLTMNWDNPDDEINNYLQELINKKKSEEELKKTLDYEYFIWDFNNWKNFFLSEE